MGGAFNNDNLIKNNHIRLGCYKKQHLLFSLVHLLLCYAKKIIPATIGKS